MNPLQAIEALSRDLRVRIRKAGSSVPWDFLASVLVRLEVVSIDARAHAFGLVSRLVDLEVLLLPEVKVDAHLAQTIAGLPRLRVLGVSVAPRSSTEALERLCACPILETLVVGSA